MASDPKFSKFSGKTDPKFMSGKVLMIPSPVTAIKLTPEAEIPFKEEETDAGWNITIVGRCNNREEDVFGDANTFSTGLILKPPRNYHFEVIEHSSLYKTGYTLCGGTRIIHPTNEDELIIPLYKFKDSDDLSTPFVVATLILRETEYAAVAQVGRKKQIERIVYEEEDLGSGTNVATQASKVSRGRNAAGNGSRNAHMF